MKNTIIAALALAALVSISSRACSADAPASSGAFTKKVKHSIGMPTSVSPPIIVLALACCDGDFCVWVDKYSQCNFPNEVFYCTVGQSNPDGTITCYD